MGPFPKYINGRNVLIVLLLSLGLCIALSAVWWVYFSIITTAFTISYFGSTQVSSNYFMPAFCRAINHQKKEISITFDDGVTNSIQTSKVLDILKQYQAPATFFCIGKNLESKEQIQVLKRIDIEGHIIGNHSYSHSNFFDFYPSKRVIKEVLQADNMIAQHIDKTPLFFRPPYGITTPNIAKAFKTLNHTTIGWSLRSLDTVIKDENMLLKRVKKKLKKGDILLFHDHLECIPAFLELFLKYVLKEGYTIVPVDQLLGLKPYA
jgi:peptidoglycan/xylan/chitin deacetylase (PgdA/CDA1 family)